MSRLHKMKNTEKPTISYFHLYKYAKRVDWILVFCGSLCSIISGAKFPLFWFLFGTLIEQFNEFGIQLRCGDNCSYNHTSNKFGDILGHQHGDNFSVNDEGSITTERIAMVGFAAFFVGWLQAFCWSLFGARQASNIRRLLFRSILRQDMTFLDTASVGELNKYLTEDTGLIKCGLSEMVSATISNFAMVIFSLVVSLWLSWKLGLTVMALSLLMVISRALLLWSNNSFKTREHEAYSKAGTVAEEALSSIRTITSLGCQEQQSLSYEESLKTTKKAVLRSGAIMGGSIGCVRLAMGLIYSISFWYGAQLFLSGEINGGGEVASIVFCVLFVARGAAEIVNGAETFTDAKIAGQRVLPVVDRTSNIDIFSMEGTKPANLNWSIEFDHVDFSYETRPNAKVLSTFNLKVPSRKTVALVGCSGCGKTTVAKLVQRWYDANGGQVKIGGYDIRKLNVLWLREQIGFVAQEPALFNATIAENIRWGKDGVTREEMHEVAKQANAFNFIMELPDKFETEVGDRGIKLSGGQKQRIAIARALVRDPKILLLDEATSALDAENEAQVQMALEKASQGRTTIIIAHRLCTVKNADSIFVLENGRVVEEGSHEKLVHKPLGRYKSLIEHQYFEDSSLITINPQCDHKTDMLPKVKLTCQVEQIDKPCDETEMDKDEKEIPFLKVLSLSKPEWKYMTLGVFFASIAGCTDSVLGLLIGLFISLFIDYRPEVLSQTIKQLAGAFVGLSVLDGAAYTVEKVAFSKCAGELIFRLRSRLFCALLKQDIGYFDKLENNCAKLCDRLSSDADQATGMTIGRISYLTKILSALVCATVICFVLSWKLGLFSIALSPIILVGAFLATVLFLKKSSQSEVGEIIGNMQTVVGLSGEHRALATYQNMLHLQSRFDIKQAILVGLSYGFSQSSMVFVYAAINRLGLYLMVNDGLPPENVYKITAVIIFAAILAGRNTPFAPNVPEAKNAAKRVFGLLERKPEINLDNLQNHRPVHCIGDITFEDVSFRYPSRTQHPVLEQLSFSVKSGETLALVGKSGCGKSTCVQLLQRFYDVDKGSIKIDGCDIRNLDVSWLRSQLGVVEQEPVIFDKTILENISLGEPLQQIEAENLLEMSHLQETLHILNKSGTTTVGRRGIFLSVGQKQRVAVARALARNPKVLLLDEATASLDAESEKVIQNALDQAKSGRTCIIVAHRLSTVKNADKIAVIEEGKIAEIGTHNELMNINGVYSRLVEAQHIQD